MSAAMPPIVQNDFCFCFIIFCSIISQNISDNCVEVSVHILLKYWETSSLLLDLQFNILVDVSNKRAV